MTSTLKICARVYGYTFRALETRNAVREPIYTYISNKATPEMKTILTFMHDNFLIRLIF